MICCLVVNVLLHLEEIIIFVKYQQRVQSIYNILYILIFYLYFFVRVFIFSSQTSYPLDDFGQDNERKDLAKVNLRNQVLYQILSLVILIGMTFKLLRIIRFHPHIGKIVQLADFIVHDDIIWFLLFFVFMVAVFSFVF